MQRGRVVKVADFIIALDHSIISPLWLVWVRAPHGSQVRQVKFYLRVCQVVFPGVLPFSPHLLIGSSRYEWNNLERDVKLNKKKKKKKKKKKMQKSIRLIAQSINKYILKMFNNSRWWKIHSGMEG